MRTFAIFNVNVGVFPVENLISKLPEGSKIVIFSTNAAYTDEIREELGKIEGKFEIQHRFFPEDIQDSLTKMRNFLFKTMKDEKIAGFLHVIEDVVEILKEPTVFLNELERMMEVFKLKSWFNTSCDECNYVYRKYNPRMYIRIDEPEAQSVYPKTIAWCSNANTSWICYNMDLAEFEDVRLEEKFKFPMYFIIEFLARRRNTKKPGELNYMNYYPSIPEELGVFRYVDPKTSLWNYGDEIIQEEGEIFKEMQVDNHPDQEVARVMEDMHSAILGK